METDRSIRTRWRILLCMFFISMFIIAIPIPPLFISLYYIFWGISIYIAILLEILLIIAIYLQRNWIYEAKQHTIFHLTMLFILSHSLVPLAIFIASTILLTYGIYIFYTILLVNHKYYNKLNNDDLNYENICKKTEAKLNIKPLISNSIKNLFYKKSKDIYLNRYLSIFMYIEIPIILLSELYINFITLGIFHNIGVLYNTTLDFTLLNIIFYALPLQILVITQKEWSIVTKIINVVVIELIFIKILFPIFKFNPYTAETLYPFITLLLGIIILRCMFIISNLKASAKYIE